MKQKLDKALLNENEGEINLFIIQEMFEWKSVLSSDEKKAIREVALGKHEEVLSSFGGLSNLGKKMCLRASAAFGQLTILESLIIQSRDIDFSILLELAAEKGHHEVVDFILCNHDNVNAHNALCLASANGHLKVVNCLVNVHKVDPNEDQAYAPTKPFKARGQVLRRSKALYQAAAAGHIDVVLSLLKDPRTRYFGLDDTKNNSSNEKAYIIAKATVIHVLMNKSIKPENKREILFGISGQLSIRGQHEALAKIFDDIEPIIKFKIISSSFGKKAPSEMINNELVEMAYSPYHSEIHLLGKSLVHRRPDGRIEFVYDKSSNIYVNNYTDSAIKNKKKTGIEPLGIVAEMTNLTEALGYKIDSSDNDSLIFSLKSSIELKEMCLHYSSSYVLALPRIQACWTIVAWIHMVTNDIFTLRIPSDVWNSIGNYFIKLIMTDLDPTVNIDPTVYIDQTDESFVFNTKFCIPSSTQFLLPGPEIIEIPYEEEDNSDTSRQAKSYDKIAIFQTIYKALYEGQSSLFKHWNSDLMDPSLNNETAITDYITHNLHSRTATAWQLTDRFVKGNIDNKGLFKEIHQYAYKNSSSLGLFKQSVFTDSYNDLEKRINSAKTGNELKGTRTKAIVDVLDATPSLRL